MSRNIPKQLQNGLIWWWDGTGKDLSWNSRDLIVTDWIKTRVLQNDWITYNGSSSTALTATWLWISLSSFTCSVWVKTNSLPTDSAERRAIWLLNSSSQNIGYFQLYQSNYYAIAWVWWANWILQPSYPISSILSTWIYELITIVETWTSFLMYRNDMLMVSWGSGTFSWTLDRITTSSPSSYWDWTIINPMVWNRALSHTEIQLLHKATWIK